MWRGRARRGIAEYGDRTREKYPLYLRVGSGHLQHGEQAIEVDVPGLLWVQLAVCREYGRHVVDLGDFEVFDDLVEPHFVQYVEEGERLVVEVGLLDVGGDHIVGAVDGSEGFGEHTAYLSIGASDEDTGIGLVHCIRSYRLV